MKKSTPDNPLQAALDAQIEQNKRLTLLVDKLQHQLEMLLVKLYGKKSEKKPSPKDDSQKPNIPSQNKSLNDNSVSSNASINRDWLKNENIERKKIKHELSAKERICKLCKNTCHVIGKVVTEQVDYIPAKLVINEHRRYKYACRFGCTVKIPELPKQPIHKSIAGAGLLAEVLVSKYQDAMPLYRQALRFNRFGVDIPSSTICDWVGQSAVLLEKLVVGMHQELLLNKKLHTDDTPVPVLAKGKTKQARLWVYVAYGTSGPKCTIYDYSATRSKGVPQKFLADYQGLLQADAYPGYDVLYKSGKVKEIGCLAHARRKFVEVAKNAKGDSIADEAIAIIAEIYAIEKHIRGWDAIKKYYYRKRHTKPIFKKYYKWLNETLPNLYPKTPIHGAVQYSLNHFRALQNVLSSGICEVDNNIAERAIKPVVIGRKNWLFAGSHEGGKRAAIIYSLIETCKQNQINTWEYLKDILTKLPTANQNNLKNLYPYNWKI